MSGPADDREPVNLRCSALIYRAESVLLCRRVRASSDEWVLPGGTPKHGESARACALRETREETGLAVDPTRIAFVLDASKPDAEHHLIEIVFVAREQDVDAPPEAREPHLRPSFVPLPLLGQLRLRPPIGGHIRGFHARSDRTAAYLGNLWRPDNARQVR